MSKLKYLYAKNICGIDNNGIKNINLVKLIANDNPKITKIWNKTNIIYTYISILEHVSCNIFCCNNI